MTNESAGNGAGRLTVLADRFSRDERHPVAIDSLDQAISAGWEIETHLGWKQLHRSPIDQDDVGTFAGLDDAAIIESDQRCSVRGLPFHEPFEIEFFTSRSIATEVEHEKRWETTIADQSAMGASVS